MESKQQFKRTVQETSSQKSPGTNKFRKEKAERTPSIAQSCLAQLFHYILIYHHSYKQHSRLGELWVKICNNSVIFWKHQNLSHNNP